MALTLPNRYPGRFNPPSAEYPQGSFKNRTAPGALDGSYLEQDWANDKEGFFQSLIAAAGLTPSDLPDEVGASQYYDALLDIIADQVSIPDATETVKGVVELATDAEAQAFTANKAIDGAKLNTAFKGVNQLLATSGYQKLPGGLIMQWGVHTTLVGASGITKTFPIAFPTACVSVAISTRLENPSNPGGLYTFNPGTASFVIKQHGTWTSTPGENEGFYYIALGY